MRHYSKIIAVMIATAMNVAALARQGFEQPPASVVVDRARITHMAPSVDVPGTVISRYDSMANLPLGKIAALSL